MKDYGIETNIEYYCCVVDLFGRAGRLVEAENFIFTRVFKNNPIIWRAMLSSCRVYKDIVTGKRATMKLIELEPQESASYVPHNIYVEAVDCCRTIGCECQRTDATMRGYEGAWSELDLEQLKLWLEVEM
ncbi:hypothetical protein V6N11_076107 [Hibiscus sabdariffa]|uniref:Pentatricopeptide repeat-containing protein n=1 Tax=Hibiscus sabdariffa TaxID=183260 RepID=A0ABR2Q5V3_9ROSI